MKNTRSSIFETNSSSSHSICISENTDLNDFIIPNERGVIVLEGGRFGWQWEKHNDAITKANYCAVSAISDDNDHKKYEDKTQDFGVNTKLLEKVLLEQTMAKNIFIEFSVRNWEHPNHSYIDHQSFDNVHELFCSENALRNFIFNKKCWLFLGNDNETAPPNFYDVDVKFGYNLSIENLPITCKLKENYIKKDLLGRLYELFEANKPKDNYQDERNRWHLSENEEELDLDNNNVLIESWDYRRYK